MLKNYYPIQTHEVSSVLVFLISWASVYQKFDGKIRSYFPQFNRSHWALSAGLFVSSLGFAVSIPFIAIYFHSELGLSLSQIGLFFGAMAVVRAFFQVGGGELSDYVERRLLLIYSQVLRAGFFLFIGLAIYAHWGFWVVGIGFLFSSILGSLFYLTANAMVDDVLPAEARLDGYAVARSAENLGWALGPAIGGFMAEQSYGLLFSISGFITLASGTVFLLFFSPPRTVLRKEHFTLSDLISVKNDPHLIAHCILAFFLYLVVAQLIAPLRSS